MDNHLMKFGEYTVYFFEEWFNSPPEIKNNEKTIVVNKFPQLKGYDSLWYVAISLSPPIYLNNDLSTTKNAKRNIMTNLNPTNNLNNHPCNDMDTVGLA